MANDEKRNEAVYISLKQEGKRTTCLLADDVSPRNLMGGQQRWYRRQWLLVVIVVNLLLERAWEKQERERESVDMAGCGGAEEAPRCGASAFAMLFIYAFKTLVLLMSASL